MQGDTSRSIKKLLSSYKRDLAERGELSVKKGTRLIGEGVLYARNYGRNTEDVHSENGNQLSVHWRP